jgi:hypothetical protein
VAFQQLALIVEHALVQPAIALARRGVVVEALSGQRQPHLVCQRHEFRAVVARADAPHIHVADGAVDDALSHYGARHA